MPSLSQLEWRKLGREPPGGDSEKPLVNRVPFLDRELRTKTKLSEAGKGGNAQCRQRAIGAERDSGTESMTSSPPGANRLQEQTQ